MINSPHNTLNILTIPWPKVIDEDDFSASEDTFRHYRAFEFSPKGKDDLPARRIAELNTRLGKKGLSPHLIVLPEASINRKEFVELLNALQNEHQDAWSPDRGERDAETKPRAQMPIVIAGVRHTHEKKMEGAPSSESDAPRFSSDEEVTTNEVRLGIYFAGKWYVLGQRKHHRWQLDESQIRQYQLEGKLTTERKWFENIQLGQRRLSVLAPTGWLSICPLICEDLAQLEPVSELIRGIGPTLLISLLMDGPQLPERWAARYASVFADDPGTAVLNQTSLGMAYRSRRMRNGIVETSRDDMFDDINLSVSSWKDPVSGFLGFDLKDYKKDRTAEKATSLAELPDALLLTIKARWTEEFSADGRSDHKNAATLEYEGVRSYRFEEDVAGSNGDEQSQPDPDPENCTRRPETLIDSPTIGLWHELREHTIALYVLDAIITKMGNQLDDLTWWTSSRSMEVHEWLKDEPVNYRSPGIRFRYDSILGTVLKGLAAPLDFGVAAPTRDSFDSEYEWPTGTLDKVESSIKDIIDDEFDGGESEFWDDVIKKSNSLLDEACSKKEEFEFKYDKYFEDIKNSNKEKMRKMVSDWNAKRLDLAIPLATLVLIHYRLDRLRGGSPALSHSSSQPSVLEKIGLSYQDATQMMKRIDKIYWTYCR